MLRKRLRGEFTNLGHILLTLEKLLSYAHLPALQQLRDSLGAVWFDLMYNANNVRVVLNKLVTPFFQNRWLLNEVGSYFAITLTLRGIKKRDYDYWIEYWERTIIQTAANNGYTLRRIPGIRPIYLNRRTNMLFLAFEVSSRQKRQVVLLTREMQAVLPQVNEVVSCNPFKVVTHFTKDNSRPGPVIFNRVRMIPAQSNNWFYKRPRAPKGGVHVNGKYYKGGQFLPNF